MLPEMLTKSVGTTGVGQQFGNAVLALTLDHYWFEHLSFTESPFYFCCLSVSPFFMVAF